MNITTTKTLLALGAAGAAGIGMNRAVDAARTHDAEHGTSRANIIEQNLFIPVAGGILFGGGTLMMAQTPRVGKLAALAFGAAVGAVAGPMLLDAGKGWNAPAAGG
jgi:hypothetical protein